MKFAGQQDMTRDFCTQVAQNPVNRAILSRWHLLGLPEPWLVAGCLFQTVWNIQASRPPAAGIKDYDIFYFDPDDLSDSAETHVQARVDSLAFSPSKPVSLFVPMHAMHPMDSPAFMQEH